MYAAVNASLKSKQAELILLVACDIFRGCGFKECAMILEKGLFFCSRSKQHLGQQQYINSDYHTSCVGTQQHLVRLGEPGLVNRVLALHAGSRGFDSHRGHMSERFFRSSRPGYPHPVSSELEKSGIRVAVGDCSVTERRRWRPPYQTGKTVHVHAKHYKHNEDGRTAPGVRGNGSVPLSHSGNVVSRIGTHTHTHTHTHTLSSGC